MADRSDSVVSRASELLEEAHSRSRRGHAGESLRLLQRALRLLARRRDPTSAQLRATALRELGLASIARGEYPLALRPLMRALAIARRSLSPREVVLALNALAIHRKYTARFQEAGRLYREAFALSMRERPRDPEVLASLLHNLGGLAHARRRYAVAEPLAREAARQRRRALGPDHPDVASDELALAAILEARGAFPEAMRLHLRAIRVLERGGGGAGARGELAIALAGLAALEYRRGRLAPSTRAFRRALLLQARTLGDKHPDVGITLANFALVRLAQGDDAEARRLAARAYRILARSLGRSHPETRASAVVAARVEERTRPRRARAGREGTTRPLARRRTNRTGATRSA